MAKKTFALAVKNLTKDLNGIYSKRFLTSLAIQAKQILYKRVKSGYGISSTEAKDPSKERLKALSENYKNFRKGKKLGPFGAPNKSNLTFSGITLESLEFEITPKGFRLKFPNKKHGNSKASISAIAQFVQEQGRPFFGLTKDERRILESEVRSELRKLARRKR